MYIVGLLLHKSFICKQIKKIISYHLRIFPSIIPKIRNTS